MLLLPEEKFFSSIGNQGLTVLLRPASQICSIIKEQSATTYAK